MRATVGPNTLLLLYTCLDGIPEQARTALIEGDDRAYRKLRDRQDALPRELYALRVKLLQLRSRWYEERAAALKEREPELLAERERADKAVREAERVRDLAFGAYFDAHSDRRELETQAGRIRQIELPGLLREATGQLEQPRRA